MNLFIHLICHFFVSHAVIFLFRYAVIFLFRKAGYEYEGWEGVYLDSIDPRVGFIWSFRVQFLRCFSIDSRFGRCSTEKMEVTW